MNSFKIKILITLLGGLIFSLVFILLALVIPAEDPNKGALMVTDKPVATAAQLAKELKKNN